MDVILYSFSLGDSNCNHEFVYGDLDGMNFTFPPQIYRERICKHCGKNEKVMRHDDKDIDVNPILFHELKEKFSKQ